MLMIDGFAIGQRVRVVRGQLANTMATVVAVGVNDKVPEVDHGHLMDLPETVTIRPDNSLDHYVLRLREARVTLVAGEPMARAA